MRVLPRFYLILPVILFMLSGCTFISPSPDQGGGIQKDEGGVINESPVTGGEIMISTLVLPEWNPLKELSAVHQLSPAEKLVYRSLFDYSEEGVWQGDLVDRFSLKESGENKVFSFTLKKDAKWQDGSPITFEDVRFTLETYLNPFYYGAWKQNLSYIDGTSDYRSGKKEHIGGILQGKEGEIEIHLTSPTSSFYDALTAPLLPAKTLQGKSPEEIARLAREGKVMGTGFFKPEKIGANEYRFVRSFPREEGGPYLDAITFRASADGKKTDAPNADMIESFPSPERQKPKGYQEILQPAPLYAYLGFNLQDPLLTHEVRKAIAQAVDRKRIVQEALSGQGYPAISLLPNDFLGIQAKESPPDPKKATAMMEALGYSGEKPLTLTLTYPKDPLMMERIAISLNEELTPLHLRLQLRPMSKEDFYASLFSGEKMQLFLHAWPYSADLGLWWKMFGKEHDVEDLGLNVYHYADPAVSGLLQSFYRTAPFSLSGEKVKEADERLRDVAFLIPLVTPARKFWVSERLHGVKTDGSGHLLHIEKWWKEK